MYISKRLFAVLCAVIVFLWCLGAYEAIAADSNTVSSTVIQGTPPTANSPSVVNQSNVCKFGISGAVQSSLIGLSSGIVFTDETCQLIALSKMLAGLNMRVASVSLLCADPRIWDSMYAASTYCPYNGKIGIEAKELWVKNWEVIPDGSVVRAQLEKETFKPKRRPLDEPQQNGTWRGLLGGVMAILLIL